MPLTPEQSATRFQFKLDDAKQAAQNKMAKAMMMSATNRGFFGEYKRSAARYAMLFTIILLIILGVVFISSMIRSASNTSSRMSTNTRNFIRSQQSWWSRFWKGLQDRFGFLFRPSYRLRLFFRMFIPFRGNEGTIPRPTMTAGRCDHLNWVQDTPDGARGFCFSAVRPKDIEWLLDMSKTPEYFDLPEARKKQYDAQMKVRIPYSEQPQDSFFVPMCDKAVFADTGKPANLFEDTGTTCKLLELPSKGYNTMVRKKEASLDDLRTI